MHDANALQAKLVALAGLEAGRLDGVAGPKAAHDPVGLAAARLINERPKLRVLAKVILPEKIGTEQLSGQHELGPGGLESQAAHEALSIHPLRTRCLCTWPAGLDTRRQASARRINR